MRESCSGKTWNECRPEGTLSYACRCGYIAPQRFQNYLKIHSFRKSPVCFQSAQSNYRYLGLYSDRGPKLKYYFDYVTKKIKNSQANVQFFHNVNKTCHYQTLPDSDQLW